MVVNSLLWCSSLSINTIAKLPLLVSVTHVSKSSSTIVNDLVRTLDQIEQLRIHLQLLIASVFMAFSSLTVSIFDICREELRIKSVDNL
jgi:hypothetical protein